MRYRRYTAVLAGSLLAFAFSCLGCAGTSKRLAAKTQPATAKPEPAPVETAPPPGPSLDEVKRAVMGNAVLGSFSATLREAIALLGSGVPLPPQARIEAQLFKAMGLSEQAAQALDLGRPFAAVLLDPQKFGDSKLAPFVVALPVRDFAKLLAGLEEVLPPHRQALLGGHTFGEGRHTLHVARFGGFALLTWKADLLPVAGPLVGSLVEGAAPHLIVRVPVQNIWNAYGAQIEQALTALPLAAAALGGKAGKGGSPAEALSGVAAMLRKMVRYAKTLDEVRLDVEATPEGVSGALRLAGLAGGEWAQLVARQPTGPLFGVELLPKETALLVSARQDPKQRAADLPDSIDQIGWMFGSELDAATKARWVETLSKAQAAMAGEGAFGVWPAEGSIGFGGVQGVVDDAAGRAAFHTIMAWVAKDLWPMAANSQTKPAIRIVVRKNAFRAGGAAADTLEVAIAWPKDKADARQVVQRLFGPRLVVAVAFAHKRAYFAFGKDYKARLAWLVKAGAGGAVANATQADGFAAAAKFHDQQRAGLLYLRLLDAARAVGLTVLGSGELSASDRPIAEALARLFGQGALLFSWNVDGNAYVIHGRLDKDGIADTVKAVMAVVMAKAAGAAAGAAPNP